MVYIVFVAKAIAFHKAIHGLTSGSEKLYILTFIFTFLGMTAQGEQVKIGRVFRFIVTNADKYG